MTNSAYARPALTLLAFVATAAASAQWTATCLHPSTALSSEIYAGAAGQFAGQSSNRATLWNGAAAVDLHVPGYAQSFAFAVDNGDQVGYIVGGGIATAGMWSGNAASFKFLHPAWALRSFAFAANGGQQVGAVYDFNLPAAALWTGTAESFVDLSPAGAASSMALGVREGQQVGWAFVGGVSRAGLWNGTAVSWTDLHPAGAAASTAYATDGDHQVGSATVAGVVRAKMWSGTGASAVDLHPDGATASVAKAIDLDHQAGNATIGGVIRAGVWKGSASTWVDLHAFLPAGATRSEATGVYHTPSSTVVVGWAIVNFQRRAYVWTGPPLAEPIDWSGFLKPVDQAGNSVFQIGRTVPCKFQLTGNFSAKTDLTARLFVAKVQNGVAGTEAGAPANFWFADGTYQYNWSTKGLTAGTWRIRVDMGDGADHSALVTLRK